MSRKSKQILGLFQNFDSNLKTNQNFLVFRGALKNTGQVANSIIDRIQLDFHEWISHALCFLNGSVIVGPSTGLMQSDTHGAWQLKAEKYTRYLTTRPERLVASSPKFQAMRQDPVQNSQACSYQSLTAKNRLLKNPFASCGFNSAGRLGCNRPACMLVAVFCQQAHQPNSLRVN